MSGAQKAIVAVVSLAAGVAALALTLPFVACLALFAPAGLILAEAFDRADRAARERCAEAERQAHDAQIELEARDQVRREQLVERLRREAHGLSIAVELRERQGPECPMEDATITVNGQHFEFMRRTVGMPGDTSWAAKSRGWLDASACEAAILEASRDRAEA